MRCSLLQMRLHGFRPVLVPVLTLDYGCTNNGDKCNRNTQHSSGGNLTRLIKFAGYIAWNACLPKEYTAPQCTMGGKAKPMEALRQYTPMLYVIRFYTLHKSSHMVVF